MRLPLLALALAVGCHDATGIPHDASVPDEAEADLAGADLARPTLPDLAPPSDLAGLDFSGLDLAVADLVLVGPFDAATDTGTSTLMSDLACDPASCMAPPGPTCDGNQVVTSSTPGTCAPGGCVYQTSPTACTYGCFMSQCVGQPLSFLGNTLAFTTGGPPLPLAIADNGGNIQSGQLSTTPAASTVSVTTEVYPPGTVQSLTLIYSTTDPSVATPNATSLPMQFNDIKGNNERWFAVIPAEPGGTHVWFYLVASGYDGTTQFDPSGFRHLTYISQ